MMSFVGRRTRSVLISGSGSSSDSAELSSGESNGEDDEVFGVLLFGLCCFDDDFLGGSGGKFVLFGGEVL